MIDDILFLETLTPFLGMIIAYSPVITPDPDVILSGFAKNSIGAGDLVQDHASFEHASLTNFGSRTIACTPGHGLHLHYQSSIAGIFAVVAGIMTMILSNLRQSLEFIE